jgi:hypothetical protein
MRLTPPQLRELQRIANMGESGLDTSQYRAMEPVRGRLADLGLVEQRWFHDVRRWFITELGRRELDDRECAANEHAQGYLASDRH